MTVTADPLLTVDELSFRYPARPMFDGWSARFGPGLHWVRGPNGSGKSTLLKLLGGVLDPILGRLAAAGVDASLRPLDYRRQVVWCGPDGVAFDHLSPAEYFGFLAGLYPRLEATRLRDLAQAMGLAPFLGQRITRLSTGTQRKVAVAAALCAGTPVVLLDEPLAALDAATLAVVRAELLSCARDETRTCIVTSHEPLGAAEALARTVELALP